MSARLKVMFCYYGANDISGPGSWLVRMLPRLTAFDVVGLAYLGNSQQCKTTLQLQQMGIPVRAVRAEGITPAEGVRLVLKVLGEELPDIIVADHVVPVFMANYWLRPAGIKLVQVVRSDDAWHWRIADEFLWGKEACRIDGVAAVSRELARSLRQQTGGRRHIMYCPSSVPSPVEHAHWRGDGFHALFLGRFENQQKRIVEMTHALIAVSRSRPWFSATLYGDGPECQTVRDLLTGETGHRILYGGLLEREDVYPHLAAAQAFILFSAYEGLSTAVQEAMACGVPVISRRMASGMEGVLVHEETALVIGCDEELGAAVDRLFGSRNTWNRLSEKAIALAKVEFSIEKAAVRWRSFLLGLPSRQQKRDVAVPPLEEVEKVYAEHIAARGPLDDYEVLLLAQYGRLTAEKMLTLCKPQACGWEVRRRLLFYLLEREQINRVQATRIATELLRDGHSPSGTSHVSSYNLASLQQIAGECAAAKKHFQALLTDENSKDCHAGCRYHLGTIALAEGENDEALTHLRICLELNPGHISALRQIEAIQAVANR